MSNEAVFYPVVIVEMQGMKCRALIDTEEGSSCANAGLLNCIKAELIKSDVRNIKCFLELQRGNYTLSISTSKLLT